MSGYVDLQVNGYAGVDFNAHDVREEQALAVCRRLASDGVSKILATVITARWDDLLQRIARLAELIEGVPEVASRVAGIHVEGPFISPVAGFVGAHPADAVRSAAVADAQRIVDAGRGHVRLVTLAPEMDAGAEATSWLTRQGVVVAAGHSDASSDQLRESIDAGLKMFTHLGNGCPAILQRHDNIIQRTLALSESLAISFIADGHHVPCGALANYLRCVPDHHVVIVTDAISAAGLGPGRYELAGQLVEVDADGAAWAACRTHYAGCATTMPSMAEILRCEIGASDEQLRRWMVDNPARLLRL